MSQVLVRVVLRIESLVSRMLCKQSSNWAILTLLPLKSKNKTNHLPYCILWGSLSFYRGLSSVSLTHFHYTPHPAIRMTPFIIHHILNHWGGGAWLSIQAPPLRDEPLLRLCWSWSFCSGSCGKLSRLLLEPVSHFLPANLWSFLPCPGQLRSFRLQAGRYSRKPAPSLWMLPGKSSRQESLRMCANRDRVLNSRLAGFFLSVLNDSRKERPVKGVAAAGFTCDSWKFLKW